MEHSIRFGKTLEDLFGVAPEITASATYANYRHSYMDWFLIPKERYSIEPPEVKSNIIEIPAGDGGLDLSESLTGYPVYNNREGYMEFYVDDDKLYRNFNTGTGRPDPFNSSKQEGKWYEIYRDICNFLNGRVMYMMLEDDARWVYHGRFTVGKYESGNGHNSEIKISYVLDPYKLLPWRTDGEYYFDSLYLLDLASELTPSNKYVGKTSLINHYQDIRINGTDVEKAFISGIKPTVPTIHCKLICIDASDKPTIRIKASNETINLNYDHTYTVSDDAEAETITVDGTDYLVKNLDIFDRKIVFIDRDMPSFLSHCNSNSFNKLCITCNGWISLDYDIGVL